MPGRAVRPTEANISIRLYDRLHTIVNLPSMPVIVADEIGRQIDALPEAENRSPPD